MNNYFFSIIFGNNSSMKSIFKAQTVDDIENAKVLFREYQAELNVDLCFQGFEEELAGLPGKYASPTGAILLAYVDNQLAGCVAVRPFKDSMCEMKRLYVRSDFRGEALGELLAIDIIKEAKTLGYQSMCLDTLERLSAAMGLYQKLGFEQVDAYYNNPLEQVVYWKLDF